MSRGDETAAAGNGGPDAFHVSYLKPVSEKPGNSADI